MAFAFRSADPQSEKVIDYQYIRNLKNKEVRKKRFKKSLSQQLFRLVLIVLLGVELCYLGWQGLAVVKTSKSFMLQEVHVTGTEKLDPAEVKRMVLEGQSNALLLDLRAVKIRLESHPWIQTAVLWRELPNTIRVHITERQPVALVLSGSLYLVDMDGRIIDTFRQTPEYSGLPVLTGITDLSNRTQIKSELETVAALSAEPDVLHQVSEIHIYNQDSTIIYLKGISFGLLVSKNGALPMIHKFIAYEDFVKKNFGDQKLIDLRYQDQIVVKSGYQEQL
ncbi:MAG TPA: FtsQ-type POTRA domain-containing protein [Acidobacteriota bacterium]|nr:FtsQ-type POTRA domain-containing protein [Acidobacteriota bacterium]